MARIVDLTDAATVHVWENRFDVEVTSSSVLLDSETGLAGTEDTNLVVIKDDLATQPGAYVTTKFRYQIGNRGRQGDEVLQGNEDQYKQASQNVYVDVIRNGHRSDSMMDGQYVQEDVMEEGEAALADWAARKIPFAIHAHGAGISLVTDNAFRLHNEISAVASPYIFRPNTKPAGALVEGDEFDINLVNKIGQLAKTLRPKLRPAKTPWGDRFVCFLHPDQVAPMRESNSQWFNTFYGTLQGGRVEDNPIFGTALGQANGVLFIEEDFVPPGLNSGATAFKANTRRAWVGGAGAISLAFGRGSNKPGFAKNRWKWTKLNEDHGMRNAIGVTSICGVKRNRYTNPNNSVTHEAGVLVIETYAPYVVADADTAYADWLEATGGSVEA